MATKVFLTSPGTAVENIVEGVGAAIQSSFLVGLTINLATNTVADNGTTRVILKSEVQRAIRELEEFILKDPNSDWG
jgi:hypothetical protein